MTKTPGEFEGPKPITKAERDARKAFRQVDAEKAMTEHEIAQKAFSANRERLKAERLAREAAGTLPRYDPDPNLPDSVSIDLIRLRPSTKRAVLAAGFKTAGDVRRASDEVLLSIPRLGKGSLTGLRNALGRRETR